MEKKVTGKYSSLTCYTEVNQAEGPLHKFTLVICPVLIRKQTQAAFKRTQISTMYTRDTSGQRNDLLRL